MEDGQVKMVIPTPPGKELIQFQTEAVFRIHDEFSNVLLADEMGLGKTIQAICYINLAKPCKVLIVCPNTLRRNWFRELEEWLVGDYEIEECTTQLFIPPMGDNHIVISSYEGVKRYGPILKQTEWDLLIVDEVHFCKTPSAQRSIATYSIPAHKKIYMTGTPIVNFPYELFPIIHSLDGITWPDFPSFEYRYCYGPNNKFGRHLEELQSYLRYGRPSKPMQVCECRHRDFYHVKCDCPNHEKGQHCRFIENKQPCSCMEYKELHSDQTGPLMIRRLKKEVLKFLPKKRRQVIELPADGKLAELVKLERLLWDSINGKGVYDSILEGLNVLKEGENDEAFELVIESLKSSRRYFFEEISRIRHQLAVAKTPEVIEHLENILESGDKIVLFAHHQDVLKMIHDHFKNVSVLIYGPTSIEDRDHRVRQFQTDPSIRLFVGSMRVAGLGLTLTAAHHVVFAELDWTPSVLTQCEDRCHRIGQEHNLLIQHLVVQGSMDSFMAKKVIAKQKSIRKALDEPVEARK